MGNLGNINSVIDFTFHVKIASEYENSHDTAFILQFFAVSRVILKGFVLLKSVFRALSNMYGGALLGKITNGVFAKLVKTIQGGLKISTGSPVRPFTPSAQGMLMPLDRNL